MRLRFFSSIIVAPAQHSRQRGSGYYEFAIVAIIFAILSGVLLRKIQFYQEEAERLAVEQVVTSVRAALASKAASLYLRGGDAEIALLSAQNPMYLLERRPPNYAGEFEAKEADTVPEGQWYFNRSSATLSYVLNKRGYFGRNGAKRLNFKVKFPKTPSIVTNDHGGPGLGGVTLERIDN